MMLKMQLINSQIALEALILWIQKMNVAPARIKIYLVVLQNYLLHNHILLHLQSHILRKQMEC